VPGTVLRHFGDALNPGIPGPNPELHPAIVNPLEDQYVCHLGGKSLENWQHLQLKLD
jgi:hypothetical protein